MPGHRPHRLEHSPIADRPTTLATQVEGRERLERIALIDDTGRWRYRDLARSARALESRLWAMALRSRGEGSLSVTRPLVGERIAYLIPPGRLHVSVQLATWRARGIAVPLATEHPVAELAYVLDDARPRIVVVDDAHPLADALSNEASGRGIAVLRLGGPGPSRGQEAPHLPPHSRALGAGGGPRADDPAMIIYTSGTTGKPKGVLTTLGNITSQVTTLVSAWAWQRDDRILHTLPLHHIHGVINALACPLWCGASCEFAHPAPKHVWERLASGDITVFMSVPTLYRRLIRAWEGASPKTQARWSRGVSALRLMVSGSAALPASTLHRWRTITGHTLLERYGMTEIGMALSNPLNGERRAGSVGRPLPGVELRLVGDTGRAVGQGTSGEIEVRGPQVFLRYWQRPEETDRAFRDGWFRTGDEARADPDGCYRILGRRSVDIIKTGGYKVSALEVEDLYRSHPAVHDVAVVGVADDDWGQRLCAAWVPVPCGEDLPNTALLRAWGKDRLAPYKVPHDFLALDALPRNAMGKVRKDHLLARFSVLLVGGGAATDANPEAVP